MKDELGGQSVAVRQGVAEGVTLGVSDGVILGVSDGVWLGNEIAVAGKGAVVVVDDGVAGSSATVKVGAAEAA